MDRSTSLPHGSSLVDSPRPVGVPKFRADPAIQFRRIPLDPCLVDVIRLRLRPADNLTHKFENIQLQEIERQRAHLPI